MGSVRLALARYGPRLFAYPNVVGVGIGRKLVGGQVTRRRALMVLVERKVPRADLAPGEVVPARLGGAATDVVQVGRPRAFQDRTERVRPAPPGVSVGHFAGPTGTLGAVLRRRGRRGLFVLSNNHVIANGTSNVEQTAHVGDAVLQPGPFDLGGPNDRIARLSAWEPLRLIEIPSWVGADGGRRVDEYLRRIARLRRQRWRRLARRRVAARVRARQVSVNLIDAAVARALSSDMVSRDVLGIGPVRGVAETVAGAVVRKSGRTTGVTQGVVLATAVWVWVWYDIDLVGLFANQIVTTNMASPGDSGSLVVNGGNSAVGLLFAGSETATVLNHMSDVAARFRLTVQRVAR